MFVAPGEEPGVCRWVSRLGRQAGRDGALLAHDLGDAGWVRARGGPQTVYELAAQGAAPVEAAGRAVLVAAG